jgi:polyhydroxybutyrate depolymerase
MWSTVHSPGRFLLAIGMLVSASACEPAVRVESFVERGSGRPYRVIDREQHDARAKTDVLVSLHAYRTTPDMVVNGYSLVRRVVKERNWLLVVPEGLIDPDGHPYWAASTACCGFTPGQDDVAYLHGVLGELKERYAVGRVFAFGVSNGSFMAHRWACNGADIDGIVSIAGAATGPDDPPCAAAKPVSVVHVHSRLDEIIHYDGSTETGRRYPSARATVDQWVRRDACTSKPTASVRRSQSLERIDIQDWTCPDAHVAFWTFDTSPHKIRTARFLVPELIEAVAGSR